MSYIQDGLFVGGIDDAIDSKYLRKKGIKQILSIHIKPIPIEYREDFEYKWVHAIDTPSQDLLFHFQECIDFIESGRQLGATLIHCEYGISRSVTIAVAYLMQKLSLSLNESLDLIKTHRPGVRPNSGFLKQLKLFERMNFTIDERNKEFKIYKLENLADKISSGRINVFFQMQLLNNLLDAGASIKDDNLRSQLARDPNMDRDSTHGTTDAVYYCGKCRKPLFYDNSIILHDDDKTTETCYSSLFIEPVKWMEENIQTLEGKVYCPKCKAKIGRFNWSGSKCTCGSWVTPSFHIRNDMVYKPMPRTK
ncbi:DgyrCDS10905 [Dimorphilus gyrociliatus]|uniref:DgyrCDS10905 n=1 Tax=Dimorphilus gyrociliatus TaxID=2664684 RepID=A0A7I8W2T8_9ANNE|nr:DgyrCDS10905 [Dimorphilus gyrociliatus]